MRRLISIFILCTFGVISYAQGLKDIRINEILVYNVNNYLDEYGENCSWFEIYNSGYSTVSLGGCYLTNDPNNPRKYRLLKSDQRLILRPQSYVIFYAYNKPTRGTFHVNFFLDDTNKNGYAYLALYDQGGKILIDSVSYHVASQRPDVSIGKLEYVEFPVWQRMSKTTPNAINNTELTKTRSEIYEEKDKHGVIITITSMSVVFTVLLVIAIFYKIIGLYFKRKERKEKELQQAQSTTTPTPAATIPPAYTPESNEEFTDEMLAMAVALHVHINEDGKHDIENTGFYLQPNLNNTTSWNDKTLTLKKTPIIKK